jgi:hypothetical protein
MRERERARSPAGAMVVLAVMLYGGFGREIRRGDDEEEA